VRRGSTAKYMGAFAQGRKAQAGAPGLCNLLHSFWRKHGFGS
jgi:hypothetical protein